MVYRTTDGGQRWEAVWRGDNLARYVWINPQDTDVIYVSTGIFDREAANSDQVRDIAGGVGIVKSADGGETWRELGRENGMKNLYIGSLFIHPQDPETLLAGAGNYAHRDGSGVYLSTDGGETWDHVLGGNRFDQITSVEFSLLDPEIVYAGSASSIFRSEDGGRG